MRSNQVTWLTLRGVAGLAGLIVVSLAGVLAHASADPAARSESVRAAAVVNDSVISSYDLEQRIKLAMVTSGQQPNADLARRLHDQILRQLVDEMLQKQEAQKFNVKITQDDVDGALKRIGQQNNITAEQINKMLDDNGIARATLQSQLTADLAWQKLVQQRLAPRVSVSDEEVTEFLNRMKETGSSTQYLAAEIFVGVESPDQECQAKESIQNIRTQLQQGASFAALARQFSKSADASAGGDMGWVTDADVPAEIAAALKDMRPGAISDPIRSAGGYYLIGLRQKRTAAGAKPEPAAPAPAPAQAATEGKPMSSRLVMSTIQIPLPAGAPKEKQEKARLAAVHLYQTVNGCGNLAALAKAEGATTVSLGAVEVKDLAPDFRKILEKTPNGRSTPPLRSSAGVQMFVICSGGMTAGHAPVVEAEATTTAFQMPTRDEVQQRLFSQELSMMARRYLRDLRRDASIDMRDN